jgi:hypothetical protein
LFLEGQRYYDDRSGTTTTAVTVYGNLGPAVSVTDSVLGEGNSGTTATFWVGLEYATNVNVTVHYETAAIRCWPRAAASAQC